MDTYASHSPSGLFNKNLYKFKTVYENANFGITTNFCDTRNPKIDQGTWLLKAEAIPPAAHQHALR